MTNYNLEEFKEWLNEDEKRKSNLFKLEEFLAMLKPEDFSKNPLRATLNATHSVEFVEKNKKELLDKRMDLSEDIYRPYYNIIKEWTDLVDKQERERERERAK